MTQSIPQWKYINGVVNLIYLAEINLLLSKKIYDYINNKIIISTSNFFLLTANNAFFESVNILHTLLCPITKQELTIQPLLKDIIDSEKGYVSKIAEEKVSMYLKKLKQDYPNQNYLDYTFLSKGDSRPIGDIIAEIGKKKRIEDGMADLEKMKEAFEKSDFHKIRHQNSAHKNKHLLSPAGTVNLFINKKFLDELSIIVKDLKICSNFWFKRSLDNPFQNVLDSLEKIAVQLQSKVESSN